MKITDVRADLLRTGVTLLRIFTDEGLVGLSEASWRHDRSFFPWLDEVIRPRLVGQDPRQPGHHWDRLAFGVVEDTPQDRRDVPIPFTAAVDIALWDLTGKATGLPVYQLLGGAARTTIPLYWSVGAGWRKTPVEMVADVQEGYDRGFRAFKIRMDWGSFRQDADPEKDFQIFKACREALPADVPLSFDANGGYSVSTAIVQGRRFEELGIAHYEEPLPHYDLPGLRQVVDALDVPVSSGEWEPTRWRFVDLIELGNPDILQPDILGAGGITELRRIADVAAAYNKPVMPHCSPFLPLDAAASLNLYATLLNGVRPHEFTTEGAVAIEEAAELFDNPILPVNGHISLPNRPGLGLTINERALRKAIVRG
jgi:L-alanine-DL-glutamate epimerase-like enolase superfamily enzyme